MRKPLVAVAVGVAGVCILGAAVPALAHPVAKIGHATVSPSKNAKPGTTLTIKAKAPLKNAGYYCILGAADKKSPTHVVDNSAGVKVVTSSKTGAVTCKQTNAHFSGTYKGKKYSCPPSKKAKKQGWSCVAILADQGTQGHKSLLYGYYTSK